jgi:hypothetical protein
VEPRRTLGGIARVLKAVPALRWSAVIVITLGLLEALPMPGQLPVSALK